MKKYFILVLIAIFGLVFLILGFNNQPKNPKQDFHIIDLPITPKEIEDSFSQTASFSKLEKVKIKGGIVPHHIPETAYLLASFYRELASQSPEAKRVIILGPSHDNKSRAPIAISRQRFIGLGVTVLIDEEVTEDLIKKGVVSHNEEGFVGEHSITSQLPFLLHEFPNIKIVPIIFRYDVKKERLNSFAKTLFQIWDEKTIILVSTDLSHGLTKEKARQEDEKTVKILEKLDANSLWKTKTDFYPGLYVFLNAVKNFPSIETQVLKVTNSGELNPQFIRTTGYALMLFYL